MRQYDAVIYGSYGFTGQLIIRECREKGLNVLLSGRDHVKLSEQSNASGFPYEAANLEDPAALKGVLRKASIVIHCAGPFGTTAAKMADACLDT